MQQKKKDKLTFIFDTIIFPAPRPTLSDRSEIPSPSKIETGALSL